MAKKMDELYYIVAGDEMQKLMRAKFPDRKTVPFREDFSKGERIGFAFDAALVENRAKFWGVTPSEYLEKMSPMIHLDFTKSYVLCFGDDACCQANLAFTLGYLKNQGYAQRIQVQIVNEYNLDLQKEYFVE